MTGDGHAQISKRSIGWQRRSVYVQHILRFNEARKQAQTGNLHHAEDGLA
jgi:hypothetical protein